MEVEKLDSEAADPIYSPSSVYENMLHNTRTWQILTILVNKNGYLIVAMIVILLITDVLNVLSWSFQSRSPHFSTPFSGKLTWRTISTGSLSFIFQWDSAYRRSRGQEVNEGEECIPSLPSLPGPSGSVHPWTQIYSSCLQLFPYSPPRSLLFLLHLQALR